MQWYIIGYLLIFSFLSFLEIIEVFKNRYGLLFSLAELGSYGLAVMIIVIYYSDLFLNSIGHHAKLFFFIFAAWNIFSTAYKIKAHSTEDVLVIRCAIISTAVICSPVYVAGYHLIF